MKLRVNADDLRTLSAKYGLSMQNLVGKAERDWIKSKLMFPPRNLRNTGGGTVIDVTDDHSAHEWREMIHVYCTREIANMPITEEFRRKESARINELEAANPKYMEVK